MPIGQTWLLSHLQLRSWILQIGHHSTHANKMHNPCKVCKAQAFFSVYMWRAMLSSAICPASQTKRWEWAFLIMLTSANTHFCCVTLHFFPTFWKLLLATPFNNCGQMRMELPPSLLPCLAGQYCSTSSWSLNCGSDLQIYVQKIQ